MTTKKSKTIQLPAIKLGVMRVTIAGITDLIMHAWDEKVLKQMADKQQHNATESKGARVPDEEFEAAKYRDEKGRDCLLACAIKKAIVAAARVDDTKKMTELRQSVFVRGERIPIEYEECIMRQDAVRLKGTAGIRYRPAYRQWKATFEIEWLISQMSAEQMLNLVQIAGFSVGIHEWRPERSGEFGRFRLESAEPVQLPVGEAKGNGALAGAMAS
jgi:hypothetical protein